MRLLECKPDGNFSLTHDFLPSETPPYAILSHTWGDDSAEVSYKDFVDGTGAHKPGYEKIRFCGEQAQRDGLRYFWIDTCCIEKSSSAEISEAINSMFGWYKKADRCYVLLSDISASPPGEDDDPSLRRWKPAFRRSRWFTRGWTLQELIAPTSVEFFSAEGEKLGDKASLEQLLHEITGIHIAALRGDPMHTFSVSDRMAWALPRTTKREEDAAYCMLGIFDIQMPLIYGEGKGNALSRLRRKINKFLQSDLSLTPSAPDVPTDRMADHNAHSQERYHAYVESLKFDQIDSRHATIRTVQMKTCSWLLEHPDYQNWLACEQLGESNGFLWIKGNPGSGKSTLMKYAFEKARLETKADPKEITIAFFFNARGENLEKTTEGMYRSLLVQILEKLPVMPDIFDSLGLTTSYNLEGHNMTLEKLHKLFRNTLERFGERSLTCFVDALDECDENQIWGMTAFFSELGFLAASTNIRWRVCFSSRHYPHLRIEGAREIILDNEEGHYQDISQYLGSRLRGGIVLDPIREEVLTKSSGIFLWVVLVVELLNKEYSRGKMRALRKRLNEIPEGLNELFQDIITRDKDDIAGFVLCLQWILFAKRPLKREELYYAIQAGTDPGSLKARDNDQETDSAMDLFVLGCSKGLAETTKATRAEDQRVEFIHESVRDFLLQGNGFALVLQEIPANFQGSSHERLKQCCVNYLRVDFSLHGDLDEPHPDDLSEMHRQKLCDSFPFLEYAVKKLFHHAELAESGGVSQRALLECLDRQRWITLNNLLKRHPVRRYKGNTSLLYIFAEKNLPSLIRIHPSILSCFDDEGGWYRSPFLAALATKSIEAIQVFMVAHAKNLSMDEHMIKRCETHTPQFLHSGFKFNRLHNLAAVLKRLDDELLFFLFFRIRKQAMAEIDQSTTLEFASSRGYNMLLKELIQQDANLTSEDGDRALQAASTYGHLSTVNLLLHHGAEVNAQGGSYGNALNAAVVWGHRDIAELLLHHGAEVNSQGHPYRNALNAAATWGYKDIAVLLLSHGADVNAQGDRSGNPLCSAARRGYKGMTELLLNHGATVNPQDDRLENPLCAAAGKGNKDVTELLLNHGADINACSPQGYALEAALLGRHVEVVELLLRHGANTYFPFSRYGNALEAAADSEFIEGVELVLQLPPYANAQSAFGKALYLAATADMRNGFHPSNEKVVNLLLSHGAIDSNDRALNERLSRRDVEDEIIKMLRSAKGRQDVLIDR